MKKIINSIIAFSIGICLQAQTSLSAGDIAFLGSNSDGLNDEVAFVLLKDIDAATSIIFTDRGWNDGSNSFLSTLGDGEMTWNSGIARSAGDIITINITSLSGGGVYSIIGDQLFAIQGSIASPTFIAGLQYNHAPGDDANWDGSATTNSTSALPNALINGDTAIRLVTAADAEQDNWQFSCALAGGSPITGTPAQIRAILHDRTNWNSDNSNAFSPAVEAGCTVTIAVATDTTDPVITCAPPPADVVAGIDGLGAIPDIVSGSSATDDTSIPGNIIITQSPTAGTPQSVGLNVITVTATDEAGNSASCMVNVNILEPPSTPLAAGDIAFVGFNLDGGDGFAFILLKDIIAGTNIKFTDCGVTNPNTISCVGAGDTTATWYAPSMMSAGDIVTLSGSIFSGGTLAVAGDQLFAYQGTASAPTFISGIHSNIETGITDDSDWDGMNTTNDESALPNQLINGVNAIRLHSSETEVDNWQFDCSLVPGGSPITGSPANVSAIINNLAYWTNDNTNEYVPAAKASCSYSIVLSSDVTPPTIVDCGATPGTITADVLGEALVPDLTGGVIATDNTSLVENLTIIQSPSSGTVINAGVTTVTLFVSDEAGNTSTCMIDITVENIEATTLTAGDIAFVGINQDGNDSFAFILLQDILAGTMISFTDCGVDNPNTIDCTSTNDTSKTWFSPTDMSAGSIITLDNNTFGLALTSIGDQILAYQGSIDNPTFLAGIHTSVITGTSDGDWDGANTSQPTSALPDQLTNGVNAIRLHNSETEVDNWQFDCSLVPDGLPVSGTPSQIAAIINNLSYWISNDTAEFVPAASSGCTYNVILDDEDPIAVCKDITVQLDDTGTASILASDVDDGSTDNKGIVSYEVDIATFDCSNLDMPVEVTLTVKDAAGNSASCIANVTVKDEILPTIECPEDIEVNKDPGTCGAVVNIPDPTFGDNCSGTIFSYSPASGSFFNIGSTVVTATATDASNNTAQCTFNVIVKDNVNPIITCPSDISTNNDPGLCGAIVNFTASATDDCSDSVSISYSKDPGTFFDVGTTSVTAIASDASGNQDSCSFNVTVIDNEPPTVVCKDFNIDLNASGEFTISNLFLTNNAFESRADNCGIDTSIINITGPQTYTCDDLGENNRTIFTRDINGNVTPCNVTITVNDPLGVCNQPPVANCKDIIVFADANCETTITPTQINNNSSDPDGDPLQFSLDNSGPFGLGDHVVNLTVSDGDLTDSCSATVTVIDNTPPELFCSNSITINVDQNCQQVVSDFTQSLFATDNCTASSDIIFTQSPPPGTIVNSDFVFTFTAQDQSGNIASCTVPANLVDSIAPVITCPSDIVVKNDSGQCGAIVDYTVDFNDNCPGAILSVTPSSSSFFPIGTTQVNAKVTDAFGNSAQCSFNVTVNDTELPDITCPSDIVVKNDPGDCGAKVDYLISANDNCPGLSTSVSIPSGSFFPVGTTLVTATATDASGNFVQCNFDVTVNDSEAPNISCPADIIITNTSGTCNQPVNLGTATFSDNCPGTTIENDAPTEGFPFGSTDVIWTATDAAGNQSSCTQVVTIDKIATTSALKVTPNSQQYSDLVEFKATIVPGDCPGAGIAAETVDFYVGTQFMGTAPLILNGTMLVGTLNAPLLEDPSFPSNGQMAPGNRIVTAVFGNVNGNYIVSNPSTNITITQEDAIVEYTGQALQATPSSNSSEATIVLSANIQDITVSDFLSDPNAGDIRNALVKFVNRDNGTDISGWIPVVQLINPADNRTGTVSYDWAVDIGNQDSESYTVGIIVNGDGYYYRDSSEDNTVITVYKPVGDFVTGGGHIIPEMSAGEYASTPNLKTNFGFNVKYNRRGNKLKGKMNIIFRRLETDGLIHTYQIKSNSIQSLGVDISDEENKVATFISKSNLKDITNPDNPISLGGNLTLRVELTDTGEPGTNDSISFNLSKNNGTLLYSSNWTGISTEELMLSGGNLLIHSGFNLGNTTSKYSNPKENSLTNSTIFKVESWPNPSNNEFNIRIRQNSKIDKATIYLLDATNKLINTNVIDPSKTYSFGKRLESGIYLVKIKMGDMEQMLRLIKH